MSWAYTSHAPCTSKIVINHVDVHLGAAKGHLREMRAHADSFLAPPGDELKQRLEHHVKQLELMVNRREAGHRIDADAVKKLLESARKEAALPFFILKSYDGFAQEFVKIL